MEQLFLKILEMSYRASFVILIVLSIRLLLKKTPKIYSYVLWSVVLLRLVCPISIESGLSIIPSNNVVANFSNQPNIEEKYNFSTDTTSENNENKENKENKENVIIDEIEQNNVTTPNDNNYNSNNVEINNNTTYSNPSKFEQLFFWGSSVWITGFIILFGYGIISLIMFKGSLLNVEPYEENIFFVDNISTAFVLGVFSPKIYIPKNLLESELEYIVLHEKKHIKRYDYFIKLVSYIAVCIHWFNPLVWLAYFKSIEDMEMSCDESVIKEMGSEIKKDYSNSLLTFTTKEYAVTMPLAFGEVSVKARIKNVLNYKSVSGKVSICLVFFVIGAIGILLLSPKNSLTLLDVRETSFEHVIPMDSEKNIFQSDITYFESDNSVFSVSLPEENFDDVVNFINNVELNEVPMEYSEMSYDVTLSVSGWYDSNKTQVEFYHFNDDFTKLYINVWKKELKLYEVVNTKEVKAFFNDMYSHRTVSLDTYTYNVEKPSEIVLDFNDLYNSKTTLSAGDEDVINLLNKTPLGRATVGESVEFTQTGDTKGIKWNIKKTENFDHSVLETQSVLLAFILIDDIDYIDIRIDDLFEVSNYRYERDLNNNLFAKDIREYGSSPQMLEMFITDKYQLNSDGLWKSGDVLTKTGLVLPRNYSVEEAIANGDYVTVGEQAYNVGLMEKFVADVNSEGVDRAFAKAVHYDKNNIPMILSFVYEYDKVRVTYVKQMDNNEEGIVTTEIYEPNIVTYVDEVNTGGREYYILTDLDEITDEVYESGEGGVFLYSSETN